MPIHLAKTDADLRACFPVMAQLRPHLNEEQFVAQVRRQEREGFRVAMLRLRGVRGGRGRGKVRAVAGFRVQESLAWGRFLYIDDLVTDAAERSAGHGERLFHWLVRLARREGCVEVDLDSGVQRFDAHRFYLRQRMRIAHHHFTLRIRGE